MNNRLVEVMLVIKANISQAEHGIFNSRNFAGDVMTNIYKHNGIEIDICYGYGYFEVFGLTNEEFAQLEDYYYNIKKEV